MDTAKFLHAVPDLTPILGDDEDARQNVLLRLWEKRDSIRDMPHYARRSAKRAVGDRGRRASREAERFEPITPECDVETQTALPLDAIIDAENRRENAENRQLLLDAISRLPPCQRDAVMFEIDPARQSSKIEAKPSAKSHRSNLYKAINRLKKWLAADDAQNVRDRAPKLGHAVPRCHTPFSTTPFTHSTAPVAASTKTNEGSARAKPGSTEAVDPSATTGRTLASVIDPSTDLVESLTRAVA